jgi:hypothetical protein
VPQIYVHLHVTFLSPNLDSINLFHINRAGGQLIEMARIYMHSHDRGVRPGFILFSIAMWNRTNAPSFHLVAACVIGSIASCMQKRMRTEGEMHVYDRHGPWFRTEKVSIDFISSPSACMYWMRDSSSARRGRDARRSHQPYVTGSSAYHVRQPEIEQKEQNFGHIMHQG